MRSAAAWLVLLSAGSACSDLKHADDASPGSSGDEAPADASTPDGARPAPRADGGTQAPPADFECDEAWTVETKKRSECVVRRVTIVDPEGAFIATGVAIARTPAGRVGIVYNSETTPTGGEMHLAHFVPKTPSFATAVLKRAKSDYDHIGHVTKIAASAPDTLHVLAHDVEDVSYSGDVVEVRLVGGAAPLTDPELVVSGVKMPTEIAIAAGAGGDVFATVRVATGQTDAGGTVAKLAARKRSAGGTFVAVPDIATNLTPGEAPETGAASLVVDPTGRLNLLYHHCEVFAFSTPRYRTLDGTTWSYRKTVDNAVVDGLAGESPRLAVYGSKKVAAYYFRKAAQSSPATAELHLARWTLSSDTPTVEIVDPSIPSPDPMHPRHHVAMAVDGWGLVHLAIVRPVGDARGYLEYRRETPATGGGMKWLSDIVDPDVLSASTDAFVDMVVDSAGRPHIAYRSGVDLKVRYATRFDR